MTSSSQFGHLFRLAAINIRELRVALDSNRLEPADEPKRPEARRQLANQVAPANQASRELVCLSCSRVSYFRAVWLLFLELTPTRSRLLPQQTLPSRGSGLLRAIGQTNTIGEYSSGQSGLKARARARKRSEPASCQPNRSSAARGRQCQRESAGWLLKFAI